MRAALLFLFTVVPLFSQTADTAIFRALMLPGSVVPPASGTNRGTLDVSAPCVRDAPGQIVSGTLDVLVRPAFAPAANPPAVDLRSGAAGQAGTAVPSTPIPRPI